VNWIVVSRYTSICLVGSGRSKKKGSFATERDDVLEVNWLLNRRSVSLEIINDWVAVGDARLVVDAGDLNDLLGGQLE
jgi:hypothetical protein